MFRPSSSAIADEDVQDKEREAKRMKKKKTKPEEDEGMEDRRVRKWVKRKKKRERI